MPGVWRCATPARPGNTRTQRRKTSSQGRARSGTGSVCAHRRCVCVHVLMYLPHLAGRPGKTGPTSRQASESCGRVSSARQSSAACLYLYHVQRLQPHPNANLGAWRAWTNGASVLKGCRAMVSVPRHYASVPHVLSTRRNRTHAQKQQQDLRIYRREGQARPTTQERCTTRLLNHETETETPKPSWPGDNIPRPCPQNRRMRDMSVDGMKRKHELLAVATPSTTGEGKKLTQLDSRCHQLQLQRGRRQRHADGELNAVTYHPVDK